MPKLAANLTMLFNEVDFQDRFYLSAQHGFKGVEYLFPYSYQKEQLSEILAKNKLTQVLHNLPAGNWDEGDRGVACQPERMGEFQEGVGIAIQYAMELGCTQLNCLAGIVPEGVDSSLVEETLITNLKFAADEMEKERIRLLIEPINTIDIPGFYLRNTAQACSIIDKVGSKNLGLQYDAYHMQIMEGDLARTVENNIGIISHIQIADNPGRNEPGTGEINYKFLLNFLDKIGYKGWIGCEYKPLATTDEGLTWAVPYLH